MNDINTYVVHFETGAYRYTNVVHIRPTGLPRKQEIARVVDWVKANVSDVRRVTNVTGPVTAYKAS